MSPELQPISAPSIRILRLPEVCKMTGLGRAMIYRLQARRCFPQSVKITDYAVGWVDREVQVWLSERVAARRELMPRPEEPGNHQSLSRCGRCQSQR